MAGPEAAPVRSGRRRRLLRKRTDRLWGATGAEPESAVPPNPTPPIPYRHPRGVPFRRGDPDGLAFRAALAVRGRPAFELADDGVQALRAYLVNLAWDAHEAQDGASGD